MKAKYAQLALAEIPRLLSCQDRNSFSPSYGSFNREFWHTRTKCFPDAIAQFGTLSLALVFAYKFPESVATKHGLFSKCPIYSLCFVDLTNNFSGGNVCPKSA